MLWAERWGRAAVDDGLVSFSLRCDVGFEADVNVDGERWDVACEDSRDTMDVGNEARRSMWMAEKSQWRIKAVSLDMLDIYLEAVRIEDYQEHIPADAPAENVSEGASDAERLLDEL